MPTSPRCLALNNGLTRDREAPESAARAHHFGRSQCLRRRCGFSAFIVLSHTKSAGSEVRHEIFVLSWRKE